MRALAEIRQNGNHLVGASSPYLLEHAHNPVDWHPWGPEAFALAKATGRPIFLSIGYSSCHWCHVMAAEVFESDDVASYLNAHFVSIKVDREERPDLDAAYMDALEALSGSGGWPMTLFLTPALHPFFGATYLPRDRFLAAARQASEELAHAPGDAEGRAHEVTERIARAASGPAAAITPDDVRAVALAGLDRVDPQWGGFRGSVKFPVPVEWTFLLHAARKWGDAPFAAPVRATLDAMAAGGIHDPIGGGFHRYSTDPRWQVPHFEKMLYDNAQLATLYFEAGAALGEHRYTDVATDTLDFLLRELRDANGAFDASLDADSGGEEGAYYEWTAADVGGALGKDDGAVVARLLGVRDAKGAPNRQALVADVATQSRSTEAAVGALWTRARPALLTARGARPHPGVDAKVVTAWNGLAIGALAKGFTITGDARYRDAALVASEAVWRANRFPEGGLRRASRAGVAGPAGVLSDYALLAAGLVELFEATGDRAALERALTLVDEADARFAAPGGGWFDDAADATPFARRLSLDDAVEPSGASALLHAKLALSALTLRPELLRSVDAALAARAGDVRDRGMGASGWLDAALLRAGPYYDVVISGDGAAGDLLATAWRSLDAPWAATARIPGAGPDASLAQLLGATAQKSAGSRSARAFVCTEGACKEPASDPGIVRGQLLEGWKR